MPPPADAGAPPAPSSIALGTLAVATPAAAPATPPPATTTATTIGSGALGRATPDDPVYLNQATAAELHRLPGIGPKRADAILTLRNRLGHFRQIEDLLKVKGIGRSSLRKLRPLVRLDPPPAKVADAGDAATTRPP
jgi:competence protein ComEA